VCAIWLPVTKAKDAEAGMPSSCFAHAPHTNDFVAGLKTLLKAGGRIVLEFPYAVDLIEHTEFDTIYPGFYAGRSIHIHFKVHVGNKAYLTHQAHLPEEVNERIMRLTPYNAPRPIKRVLNMEDTRLGIFPTFKVIDRGSHLLAVLNVGLPAG
jgi:hypothetical protein